MQEPRTPPRAEPVMEIGPELFLRFVESTSDLLTVVDREGRFLYVNPASREFLGLAPEACLGRSALEFVHPEDRERTRAELGVWLAGSRAESFSHENRQLRPDGAVRHALWTITPRLDEEGRVAGFVSIARDITDRKRFEDALGVSEALQREILASMLDALVGIDLRGTIRLASASVERIFGWTRDELVGKNVSVLMPEPHRSAHDRYLAEYVRTGRTWILGRTREFEIVRGDGRRIVCELSVSRADPPGQEPILIGSFRDVTERQHAAEALADSERRFRAVFEGTYQHLGLLRPDGTVVEINRTALEAVGVPRAHAVGKPFWEGPWFRETALAERVRGAIVEAAHGRFVRFELDIATREGFPRAIDFSIQPVRDEEGRVVLLIPEGRDITELKRVQRAETSMLRALATIGENAAVLAHEIKNPLTGVNLALRAVADHLGEDQKAVLEDLASRMRRLEALMRRTLSFARPLDLRPTPCSMREVLGSVGQSVRAEAEQAGVALEIDAPRSELVFPADRERLGEVLLNLLRNALEVEEPRVRRIRLAGRRSGDEVELSVEDDGPGVPPQARETIFRPFETSKSAGTGLGLAIARKIVEEHGGHLGVEEGALGGARFVLTLPLRPLQA
jgi:PAS domain S-box-containing protein